MAKVECRCTTARDCGRALVEGKMQRHSLVGRIAPTRLALRIELRQASGIEEAEAGIGRRHEIAVVEPRRHVAGRAGGQAALEQRLAPFDDGVADSPARSCRAYPAERLGEEIRAAEIAALQRQAERSVAVGDQRRDAGIDLGPICRLRTPSASTMAPEVSPPPTTMRRTPPVGQRSAPGRRRSARLPRRRSPAECCSARRRPAPAPPSNRRSAAWPSCSADPVGGALGGHLAAHQSADRPPAPAGALRDRSRPAAARRSSTSRTARPRDPAPPAKASGCRQAARARENCPGRPSAMPEPPVTSGGRRRLRPASAGRRR